MKAKTVRGSGFRGVLDYALGKQGATIVAGTMAGENARELATEFGEVRRLRPTIGKPVWHCSLALPSGENFSPEQWQRVATAFLSRMGISPDSHQWIAIQHYDTEHAHIHLIVNRIALDGRVWGYQNDVYRAIDACQELEREFGMELTAGRESARFCEPSFSRGEIERYKRTGEAGAKIFVARAIAEATAQGPIPVMRFIEILQSQGITAVPNVAKTGKMNGFSFVHDGVALKGSDVGAAWKSLSEVVLYDSERDAERMQTIRTSTAVGRPTGDSKDGRTGVGHDAGAGGDGDSRDATDAGASGDGARSAHESRGDGVHAHGTDVFGAYQGGADGDHGTTGDRDEATVETENPDVDYSGGLSDWDAVLDTVAVLARSEPTDVQVDTPTGELKMSKSVEYKKALWERQAEALGAPFYRLTVRGRGRQDGKTINLCKHGDTETPWTADDVSAKIPVLEQWNARGYDIYVTPIDDHQHHILIDDLTADGVVYVKENYSPCIICSSSNGNWQAVIRVPKNEKSPAEQSAGNQLMQLLNHLPDGCGGDEKISAVTHPFRMTGFRNKKPTREDFQSKIEFWAPGQCERTAQLLDEIRNDSNARNYQAREAFVDTLGQGEIPEAVRDEDTADATEERAFREYAREWNRARGLHQQHPEWGAPDMSRWDYRASRHLIEKGYGEEVARKAIRRCSPSVHRRHSDAWAYAVTTVARVVQDIAREMEREMERM